MTYEKVLKSCDMKCIECRDIWHRPCIKPDCVTFMTRRVAEKQILKKILRNESPIKDGLAYGMCECGNTVWEDHRFCSNCGQRLDWGNTKEIEQHSTDEVLKDISTKKERYIVKYGTAPQYVKMSFEIENLLKCSPEYKVLPYKYAYIAKFLGLIVCSTEAVEKLEDIEVF